MKHTKKLVSVPETEYNALLGLLTGNDPLKKEKFITEQKINETLSKPKLSQLERGVKYQALDRKRRMLNKKIEGKPFRVLIEQGINSVMPTTGIAPARRPEQQVQEIQHEQQQKEPAAEEEEVAAEAQQKPADFLGKYHGIIAKRFKNRLYAFVNSNCEKLGITEDDKIITNMQKKAYGDQEGSDFNYVLDYMIGGTDSLVEKKSTSVLIKRLMKIEEIKNLVNPSKNQEGQGRKKKRYVIDLKGKPIKTPRTRGLVRFKPMLWSKIPV